MNKMKIKRKNKLKGMTLVEVIVALAVFTIMASLLVTVCVSISNSVVRTNRLTREINVQAPTAENRITDDTKVDAVKDSTNTIKIVNKPGSSGALIEQAVVVESYTVQKSNEHGSETVNGRFKFFKYNETP